MFHQDESMLRYGVTALDNLFLTDYLPSARGDYVKVYLYVLFLSNHPREGMSMVVVTEPNSWPSSPILASTTTSLPSI